jgi:enoyl-CoA hydratase
MSTSPLLIRREDGVAIVTMDNPPVNALSEPLLEDLATAFEAISTDRDTRAVVLTGSGEKAFAAGADLPELLRIRESERAVRRHISLTRRVLAAMESLRQPLIGAAQGTAVGGGFELLLACDFAIADERAALGLPEVSLGLMPGAGGTQRLARRIGAAASMELILRGRLIKAPEAQQMGIISRAAPAGTAFEHGVELARELAAGPTRALEGIKRAIRLGASAPLEDALDIEQEEFVATLQTADAALGIEAFLARRQPKFEG